ncbi:hypothetical protein LSAT2_008871 [Lamellibrachia satsuma]|nr:hypothetical protein LSAT2_008871 [Lamellibrachia satsuma]
MDGGQPQTELRLPTTSEFMSSDDPMSPGGGTVHEFSFSARHLSASEVVADILHEHGANILVHCALIRSRDRITQEILRDTMQKLADFQPALWMKIDSDTPNALRRRVTKRFTEMPDDDRVVDVTVVPANDAVTWQQVAESELTKKFDSQKGPLWKIVYVEMEDHREERNAATKKGSAKARPKSTSSAVCHQGLLLFKIHHVIADGVSMLDLLQRQFIPMLNRSLKHNTTTAAPQFISSLPMAPPADESFHQERAAVVDKAPVTAVSQHAGVAVFGRQGGHRHAL